MFFFKEKLVFPLLPCVNIAEQQLIIMVGKFNTYKEVKREERILSCGEYNLKYTIKIEKCSSLKCCVTLSQSPSRPL